MGWCHEFGVTVEDDCGHPMTAGESSCHCTQCGAVCRGQFSGCHTVWANGPLEVVLAWPRAEAVPSPPLLVTETVQPFPVANGEVIDPVPPVTEAVSKAPPPPQVAEDVPPAPPPVTEAVSKAPPPPQVAEDVPAAVLQSQETEAVQPFPLANGERRTVRTAWPLKEGQAMKLEPPAPERVGSPADTTPRRAADEARDQVFEWLRDSFEGLNSQIRVLSDAVNRQQQSMGTMTEAQAAAGRLSELADALPERIGTAVQEAVTAGQRLGGVAPDRRSASVRGDDDPVRSDGGGGSSEGDPAEGDPVKASAPEASAPEASAPEASARSETVPGVRTQLSTLASAVQARVNRSR